MDPKIGEVVVYVDGNGDESLALVTDVLQENKVTLAFVSGDDHLLDGYGRQLERKIGVPNEKQADKGAAFWKEAE